jgi:homoserine O-acetyltransferase
MKDAIQVSQYPSRDLVAGFDRPGGGWLQAQGRLTGPDDGAAVIVLGGVSAGRHVFDDAEQAGWWPGVAERGGAIDARYRQVLSFDFLADAARPFPALEDQSAAVIALADAAGLERFSIIGASFGGVIGLDIARLAPDRVERLDVLCAAARPNPMARAWRSIQRDIVQLADGDVSGVQIARKLAMTTYRTAREFDQRFTSPDGGHRDAAGVEAYLAAAGARYGKVTSPQRFLALSKSMDSADVAVETITAPVRFLAFTSDQLVPPRDIHRTAARISRAEVFECDSLYGHDGFLKEVDQVNAFLRGET